MAKIKLSLPTGGTEEKLLLNAFKADNNSYIVFDAENVGSMGLPIILVCKLENDRVIKITDPEEWTKVKGYLKEIISGNNKEYINLSTTLNSDEIYFTQLTLPVASFDALKNAYAPAVTQTLTSEVDTSGLNDVQPNLTGVSAAAESLEQPSLVVPMGDSNVNVDASAMANPILGDLPSLNSNDEVKLEASVMPEVENVVSDVPSNPSSDMLSTPADLSMDAKPTDSLVVPTQDVSTEDVYVGPALEDEPVNMGVDNTVTNPLEMPSVNTPVDFSKEKEEFLTSCSNLFDSWVEKLQNKIN